MTNALLIARRNFGAYFHGYSGWLILGTVLFVIGIWFQAFAMGNGARYSHEVLEKFFETLFGVGMCAPIAFTMGSIAEERQTGTDVLLHTSPIKEWEIVLGKYLAAMGMFSVLMLLSTYMPALIFVNGKVSYSHIAVGYLGAMLCGSTVTAMGIFSSSLFRTQIPALLVTAVIVVTFLICWLLSDLVDSPFSDVIAYIALFDKHYQSFEKGKLLSNSVIFYGSLTWGFLMLATRSLEGRRWS